MNRFLKKILIFSILPAMTIYGVFLMEDGTTDPFYQRFISSKQNSLIIGTSRAAQGIQPAVFNEVLGIEKESQIYNYAFTIADSPYGEIYTRSILSKLNSDQSGGIFILAVDPWTISSDRKNPNEISLFSEKGKFLDRLIWVNDIMNIQYLSQFYEKPFFEIILRRFLDSQSQLHKDGWLEIKIKNHGQDYTNRLNSKIELYKEMLSNSSSSKLRIESLLKLIKQLKKHGQVFMVRLPVDEKILNLENELVPEFSELVSGISRDYGVPFLDFSNCSSQFQYTDGNHLEIESGKTVTTEIAKWIKTFSKDLGNNKTNFF